MCVCVFIFFIYIFVCIYACLINVIALLYFIQYLLINVYRFPQLSA